MSDSQHWTSIIDPKSGRTYYYHNLTRETTWSKPECLEDNRINEQTGTDDAKIVIVEDSSGGTDTNLKDSAHNLDPGLTNNVIDRTETPKHFLERILVHDEKVMETFDVKFPTQMLPVYKIVQLLIFTLGLYAFVLLFRKIRRYCYKKRWCTPSLVSFEFGKMCITSKGRVICWKENVNQFKPPQKNYSGTILLCYLDWCLAQIMWICAKLCISCLCADLCAPPTNFSYENTMQSYRISDVKQVTQYMTSEAHCIWCCLDYQAGVEISFNQFNHGSNHLQVASRSWFSSDHFGEEGQAAITSASRLAYYSWGRGIYGVAANLVGAVESAVGVASNLHTLFVYADTLDRVHNGDVDSILRDVNALHRRIVALLPTPPDAIFPEKVDREKFKKSGLNMHSTDQGNFKHTDQFKNVNIVADDWSIQIPQDWMPILDNENIICTSGQVPRMTKVKWILSVLTCGYWYFARIRRQKYTRSALVLTNKRLISIDIYERTGTVPLSLANFSVQVRSYILENVYSGFIRSESKESLEAGIECEGGAIFVNFSGSGRSSLPFAHAMQMSVRRKQGKLKASFEHIKANVDDVVSNVKHDLIPYFSDEVKINFMKGIGIRNWEPFGAGIFADICNKIRGWTGCGVCWTSQVQHCCSREACNDECCCAGQSFTPFFFPCLPYILTCAYLPLQYETTTIITNMSIIRVATKGNYGLCGCLRFIGLLSLGPFARTDSIIISWEAIKSFSGFQVQIRGDGRENMTTRLCRNNCCGQLFCPIGVDSADIKVDFKGNYGFSITKEDLNKSWIRDEELNSSIKLLTKLQLILQEDENSKVQVMPSVSSLVNSSYVAAIAELVGAPSAPAKMERGEDVQDTKLFWFF